MRAQHVQSYHLILWSNPRFGALPKIFLNFLFLGSEINLPAQGPERLFKKKQNKNIYII